jgi:antitoxin component of MazEF toxin-antitoxin module
MKQKIIAVGNSAAVTIPKGFLKESDMQIGDEVIVETDLAENSVLIKFGQESKKISISGDLNDWADDFIEKFRPALEELAKK